MRVNTKMPAITSTVPAAIHAVNGSPRITTPIRMVDIGPTMPVCAAIAAPMRSMAIITISTGTAVHRVALSTDSQITSGATAKRRAHRPQQHELRDAEQAGHAGRQADQAQRAQPLDQLAAVDQVDRIAHRAQEHQERAPCRAPPPAELHLVAEHQQHARIADGHADQLRGA